MAPRPLLHFGFAAIAISIVAHSSSALAGPRGDGNGRTVFTGATVPNASAITLNPAALGLGTVPEIFAAVYSTLDHYRIQRRTLDGDETDTRVRDIEPGVGGTLAVILRAGERSSVGFEAKVMPPEQLGPKSRDLRYASAGGTQRDYVASISASFKVTSRIFFGASLSHDHARLRMRYSLDEAARDGTAGIESDCGGAPCGYENPLAREDYQVDVGTPIVSTKNLQVNIGFVFRLADDVYLGLAYHTPPGFSIQSELDGNISVKRSIRDGGERLEGGSTVYISYPASVDGELRARMPGLLDLHVGGRWMDLSRFQAFDVRAYGSDFQEIPEWMLRARGLHDAFSLWAGVEQVDTGAPLRFGGRLGIETSAVDDTRTTALTIAPTSITLDGGVQLRVAPSWVLQLSYGLQYFPKVIVIDSAFDPRHQANCIDAEYDYTDPACAATRDGYGVANGNGDYERFQHAFRLAFRYELP